MGTAGGCSGNQCTCNGVSLGCGANVPTCGSWDFNSNKVENWRYGSYDLDHGTTGALHTATINGSPALTASFTNTTGSSLTAEFSVDLCPNAAIVNPSTYALSYDVYFLTTSGGRFGSGDAQAFMTDGSGVLLSCQPFISPASDEWSSEKCTNLPSAMKNLTLVFRLPDWTGDVYVDNVRFTPK